MGDGPPGFTRDFPCPALLRNLPSEPALFRLPGSHRLWPIVPDRSTRRLVSYSPASRPDRPYNPVVQARRFGLFRVRSPLLTESLLFSLPAGTEMVHFPALPSTAYVFGRRYPGITPGGLPHSEISGSTLVCSSPELIAACHVLHRLLAPRHPPYALSSLTTLGTDGLAASGRIGPADARRRARSRTGAPHSPNHANPSSTTSLRKATVCRVFSCQIPAGTSSRLRGGTAFRRGSQAARARRPRRLVENTGLEPATSWLQTRRSPS